MLDLKAWLESTGLSVYDGGSLKPYDLPCVVFLENRAIRGSDDKNCIMERNVTLELYSNWEGKGSIENHKNAESRVERLLDNSEIEYERESGIYIKQEKLIETIYHFEFIERAGT